MTHGTFATALNCIDGRAQLAVNEWMRQKYDVDFVDTITGPGMDKIVNADDEILAPYKKATEISVTKHGSKTIAVVGHYDCAGNPVSDEEHKNHIRQAVEKIKSWNWSVDVVGLWVNDRWQVEQVV